MERLRGEEMDVSCNGGCLDKYSGRDSFSSGNGRRTVGRRDRK